jgi:hypothetical protein
MADIRIAGFLEDQATETLPMTSGSSNCGHQFKKDQLKWTLLWIREAWSTKLDPKCPLQKLQPRGRTV